MTPVGAEDAVTHSVLTTPPPSAEPNQIPRPETRTPQHMAPRGLSLWRGGGLHPLNPSPAGTPAPVETRAPRNSPSRSAVPHLADGTTLLRGQKSRGFYSAEWFEIFTLFFCRIFPSRRCPRCHPRSLPTPTIRFVPKAPADRRGWTPTPATTLRPRPAPPPAVTPPDPTAIPWVSGAQFPGRYSAV